MLFYKSEFFYGHANAYLQKGLSLGFDLLQAILGIGVIYGVSKALCAVNVQDTQLFKGLYKHGFNIYLFHATLNYVVLVCFETWGWFDWVNLSDANAGLYILFRLAFTYLVPILISMAVFGVQDIIKVNKTKSETPSNKSSV